MQNRDVDPNKFTRVITRIWDIFILCDISRFLTKLVFISENE